MKEETKFYRIDYSFSSHLGSMIESSYINCIKGELVQETEDGDISKEIVIGKIQISIILVSLAINNDRSLLEVFDNTAALFDIGQDIFDFDKNQMKDEIIGHFEEFPMNSDICIIERLEIIPAYRGKNLGKKMLKDIYNRFNGSCGFFVLKAFPLQFEPRLENKVNIWDENLKLKELEKDEEKARYKLIHFYQQCGFELIPDFSEEIMFINLSFTNKLMDEIELQ